MTPTPIYFLWRMVARESTAEGYTIFLPFPWGERPEHPGAAETIASPKLAKSLIRGYSHVIRVKNRDVIKYLLRCYQGHISRRPIRLHTERLAAANPAYAVAPLSSSHSNQSTSRPRSDQ